MAHTGHLATAKGRRVFLTMKDGTHTIDRFLGKTDRYLHLEKAGRVPTWKIKGLSDYKQQGKAQ